MWREGELLDAGQNNVFGRLGNQHPQDGQDARHPQLDRAHRPLRTEWGAGAAEEEDAWALPRCQCHLRRYPWFDNATLRPCLAGSQSVAPTSASVPPGNLCNRQIPHPQPRRRLQVQQAGETQNASRRRVLTRVSGVTNILRKSMSTGRREEGAKISNNVFSTPRAS